MDLLPEALYGASEMREADRRALKALQLTPIQLMERAGAAVFRLARERFPRARRWRVACGPGNNGGDGYVIARYARAAGMDVETVGGYGPHATSGPAQTARDAWFQARGPRSIDPADGLEGADLVIDAMFGTGLARAIGEPWKSLIGQINAGRAPVLSVDLPSGLDADSGRGLGDVVRAAVTVTLIGLKPGLFTASGRGQAGLVLFDDLGVPPAVFDGLPARARRIAIGNVLPAIRQRREVTHKGEAGRVLVVGGQPGMTGAVRLAGEAAYRAGAGLVAIITHPSHFESATWNCPEIVAASDSDSYARFLDASRVTLLGPGLGQGLWAEQVFRQAVNGDRQLLVDADGLNLLARDPRLRHDWILTPHPGEAARLLDASVIDVQSDRIAAAREIARRYGGVCVLKGSGTIVATDGQPTPWLCDRGNSALATAGTGDVLAGVIGALWAGGMAAPDAARVGVWVHARAAERMAPKGERGWMAHDLIPEIRNLINECADG